MSWYNYRVYCNDEAKYKEVLSQTVPTTCPTNTAHTIATGTNEPVILEERSDGRTKIDEGDVSLGGFYKTTGHVLKMPSSYTSLGDITSNVSANDTVINVPQAVIDGVKLRDFIRLDDATNNEVIGKVLRIDDNANTITVSGGATQSFLSATPTNVINMTTYGDYTQPIDIGVLSFSFNTASYNDGDGMEVSVYPETTIGAITANVGTGVNVIDVQQSVLDNIKRGFCVSLVGGGVSQCLGCVTAIDVSGLQITTSKTADSQFLSADPTYVKMTVDMCDIDDIGPAGPHVEGEDKIGASIINKDKAVRVSYHDYAPSAGKKLCFRVGHLR